MVATCIAALAVAWASAVVHRAITRYHEHSSSNEKHFVDCANLPSVEDVKQALLDHQDVIEHIEQVSPGHTFVHADRDRSPGRADIVLLFATVQDSRAIRRILGADTLFGVPYRRYNT